MTEAVAEEVAEVSAAPAPTTSAYDFDLDFQQKIAALACRHDGFMRRTSHLLDPSYFTNVGDAALVNLALRFYKKHKSVMTDKAVASQEFKDAAKTKLFKASEVREAAETLMRIYHPATDLSGAEFCMDQVAKFARTQAVTKSVMDSVGLLERLDFDSIQKTFKHSLQVGLEQDDEEYDYVAKIKERSEQRKERLVGLRPPTGIPTGFPELDDCLYHRGWGRRELSAVLGGAKAGKTTALIGFGQAAYMAGYNVLYLTLEVAAPIISDRLDASIASVPIKELSKHILEIEEKIAKLKDRATPNVFKIREFASGTLTPAHLDTVLSRYQDQGITFDLVIVDYADIMAPTYRMNDPIENSKSVWIDLRALAHKFNVAMLTATQTNREGFKSTVAKAEHLADDFNKARTVDILISISSTEEERSINQARLYFALSRNTESGFTLRIEQDLSRMKFIKRVLGKE